MQNSYPGGTVRALLETDLVTEKTRQVLTERLEAKPGSPQFFSASEFSLLRKICDQLILQEPDREFIDVAGKIDERLHEGGSDGWRYDTMPPDGDAYKRGLAGVDETAVAMYHQTFQLLETSQRDDVLHQIQRAEAPGETWKSLPANRFFEELLAEATNTYYAHPIAQEEIGYVGMADVPGWQRIGLNEREEREPEEVMINDE